MPILSLKTVYHSKKVCLQLVQTVVVHMYICMCTYVFTDKRMNVCIFRCKLDITRFHADNYLCSLSPKGVFLKEPLRGIKMVWVLSFALCYCHFLLVLPREPSYLLCGGWWVVRGGGVEGGACVGRIGVWRILAYREKNIVNMNYKNATLGNWKDHARHNGESVRLAGVQELLLITNRIPNRFRTLVFKVFSATKTLFSDHTDKRINFQQI